MKVNLMKVFEKKRILRTYILSLLIVILMLAAIVYDYGKNGTSAAVIEGISDSLIRFHVIANSDSEEDQKLKLKVRDEILDRMNGILEESENIEETRQLITDNRDEIKRIAERVIEENNYDYDINVKLKMEQFPLKTYGDIILPPGEYEALLVEIGEAKGKNWWCVMFPPLCFVDVTHGVVPEETKETLKRVLTDEEYDSIVMAEPEEDMPIKIRFKFLEWFNFSRDKDRDRQDNDSKVFVNRD
ncbi:stage II sporulation protein R [Vallitalea guaymasensis]|uniref:Stage II sporulation protein R n=1 Tax=Vallitalea guaymasensis TaxID=1185412 RepID=A0A8J8MAC9_9FIRM|nr:stage II sporulation protein R [Vallitalea guaymasensis]QUH29045.1 stage II sporulation protein R [Vallitalea guaymasensis]